MCGSTGCRRGDGGVERETSQPGAFDLAARGLLAAGLEKPALRVLIQGGVREVNALTNRVFHARHPERQGASIKASEKGAAAEWIAIRDTVVRPALAAVPPGAAPARPAAGTGGPPAPASGGATASGGCGQGGKCRLDGGCRICECRLVPTPASALAAVPPSLLFYPKRVEQLHPEALAAYQAMYAAASKALPLKKEIKLVSGYRGYQRQADLWNRSLLEVFRMLGCTASLPCLERAITATSAALATAPRPLPRDAWLERFRQELSRAGCKPDCRRDRVEWLVKKYNMRTSDPLAVAVHHKRQTLAPPGTNVHATGRALDIHVGGSLSSAPANVAGQRANPAYKWLACHAARFGFHPYLPEPWHWEYTRPSAGS